MAAKGEMQRLAFDMMRRTHAPVTSPQISTRYCERHGIPLDGDAFANILSRVISRLTKMKAAGDIQKVVIGGRYGGWTIPE